MPAPPTPDQQPRHPPRAAARGGARRRAPRAEPWDAIGWRPAYVIEIAISPLLRERDPDRPLSLQEALELGHPRDPGPEPADPEPEAEP